MFSKRIIPYAAFAVTASIPAFALRAQDPACRAPLAAVEKQAGTPYHGYETTTAAYTGGKPRTTEMIQTANALFIRAGGKWMRDPVTPQQMRQNGLDASKASEKNAICHKLRDEAVNGVPASVYDVQQSIEGMNIQEQIWIANTTGLPLRIESDRDVGGAMGKGHASSRFEYANVQAPPVTN